MNSDTDSSNPLKAGSVVGAEPATYLREVADEHASTDEYAARFKGAYGEWMLKVQEDALLSLMDNDIRNILDVGGGHGQVAIPLASSHRSVTVLGSTPRCAERLQPYLDTGTMSFRCGNLLQMPYGDHSFDGVVCFRLLSHSVAWKLLVRELCRVAEHSVVIDYPVWLSVNLLSPLTFALKKRLEGNTRTYKLFSGWDLRREFRKHGFYPAGLRPQFFFPMALHRALTSRELSSRLEGCAGAFGLTKLFGSPVIARFDRR